jgi:hypothetical protein
MITLQTVELINRVVTLLIAYIITETTCGYVRTLLACKLGDDTGKRMGLLSWNPLVHIDPIGLIFLIFFRVGWGKYVPVMPHRLSQPHRLLKTAIVYYSDVFTHAFFAFSSLIGLFLLFGGSVAALIKALIQCRVAARGILMEFYPLHSSLTLTLGLILTAIIYLSIILAVISFIMHSYRLYLLWQGKMPDSGNYGELIISMLLMFIFVEPLRIYVICGISEIAHALSGLFL